MSRGHTRGLVRTLLWLAGLGLLAAAAQAAPSLAQQGNQRLLQADVAPARQSHLREHLPHGPWSTTAANESLLVGETYITCYDATLKVPLWVAYRLCRKDLEPAAGLPKNRPAFRRDPRLPATGAIPTEEYAVPGFQRGHMAPHDDFVFDPLALVNTYVTSNVCPQYGSFNGGLWAQFERRIQECVAAWGTIYVTTGPIFDADANGRRDPDRQCRRTGTRQRIGLPTHFYKLILAWRDGRWQVQAIVLAHQKEPLSRQPGKPTVVETLTRGCCSVDSVEQVTGVNFFPGLPDEEERMLEAAPPGPLWP